MDYPTFSMLPDGDNFNVEIENAAIEPQNTDGGYMFTRPRYTRAAPRTWTFQYSELSAADRDAMETFFRNSAKGSSVAFNWTHPLTGETVLVRYSKGFKLQLTRVEFSGDETQSRYKTNTISITEV